jgi:hypothetical protein
MIGAASVIGGNNDRQAGNRLGVRRGESGVCAEAAGNDDVVYLRNTLSPDATFALRRDEWEALLFAVKEGISTTCGRCPWDTVVFARVRRSSADTSFIAAGPAPSEWGPSPRPRQP